MLNRPRKNQRWIPAYKARYWANIWRDNLSKPHCLLWLPGKCPLKPWQWLFRKRLLITSGSYHCGSVVKDLTGIHGDMGWIPGLAQWIKGSSIAVSCGVGRRRCSDPVLLWLWRRLAATVLIRPLPWEPPYAVGVALEKQKSRIERQNQYSSFKKNHVFVIKSQDFINLGKINTWV